MCVVFKTRQVLLPHVGVAAPEGASPGMKKDKGKEWVTAYSMYIHMHAICNIDISLSLYVLSSNTDELVLKLPETLDLHMNRIQAREGDGQPDTSTHTQQTFPSVSFHRCRCVTVKCVEREGLRGRARCVAPRASADAASAA